MKNSDYDLCCKFLSNEIKVISCNLESTFLNSVGGKLTQILQAVAGLVESPSVELQPDDGEDDDGKEEEESNVDQRTDSLGDRGDDNLETWGDKIEDIEKIINKRNSGS